MEKEIDPFDEFEFKPLTDGLGFHKKAEKIKNDIKSSGLAHEATTRTIPEAPSRSLLYSNENEVEITKTRTEAPRAASQSISDLIASLPPSFDFLETKDEPRETKRAPKAESRPQIFQPIAREEYKPEYKPEFKSEFKSEYKPKPEYRPADFGSASALTPATAAPVPPAMTNPTLTPPGAKAASTSFKTQGPTPAIPVPTTSPYSERLNESFAKAFPHASTGREKKRDTRTAGETVEQLEPVSANLAAGLLDAMVVTGVSTILLVAILAITKVNLVALLTNAQTDGPTQFNLLMLFVAVLQMYMLTARSFFGASLGEWAFDMQLGDEASHRRPTYPLLVAWRTIFVTITGLIIFPILSLLFKKDTLQLVSGLQLYRRV